jgi:hypothetical protein
MSAWRRATWAPVNGPAAGVRIGEAFKRLKLRVGSIDGWSSDGNYLVISASIGDSSNLWRVPISLTGARTTGPAQRLTFGTGEDSASLASDGRIAFVSGS